MDFPSRNLYRSAIEQLARGSVISELDVAERALAASRAAADPRDPERFADPGYHLIAGGRRALERDIDFRQPPRLWLSRLGVRLGIGGYIAWILLSASLLLALG